MAGARGADKTHLRCSARRSRAARGDAELRTADRRLGEVLAGALPDLLAGPPSLGTDGPVLGAYVSLPGEPPTWSLRRVAREHGCEVLLPWLRTDLDLDWVQDAGGRAGPGASVDSALRPPGARLGRAAVLRCRVLLVPALAVDTDGRRLGQGGGSYDRVLARVRAAPAPAPLVLAVVHAGELLDAAVAPLPHEPHDIGVDGALTPDGIVLLRAGPAE